MISLSEIDTTVKRASKAVGFSWGIAEEVGKSISLLEMFGLPGLKNLNQHFKAYKDKKFQNVSLISKTNSSKIRKKVQRSLRISWSKRIISPYKKIIEKKFPSKQNFI